ncbi:MAG: phosphate ABC transporter substrate-binding protein [Planctomycetota bacterium]|nr:phosphate ABC transporter substrate-binding protein [Planctomycetota bacterium]
MAAKILVFLFTCFLSVCVFLGALYSCADTSGRNITVKGSDTMVNMAACWAEEYMKEHRETTIAVTGGGSGVGIAALINGATDVCLASRHMSEKERELIRKHRGKDVLEIAVARDAVAVFVHTDNPVREVSLDQLAGIYTGKITNWRELGWTDKRIILCGRENTSGTYAYFKEKALKKQDFTPDVLAIQGTSGVVHAVANDPYAIGYGGIGYSSGVRNIALKKNNETPGIEPSSETVEKGTYPLARSLFFYVLESPSPEVQRVIDWVLSDKGQKIVVDNEYYPLCAGN